MKTLYIVRHAKSSWDYPELSDFERPLNKRGNNDAPLMGKILKKLEVLPELIISSPALRAYKTAKIISVELGYELENIETSELLYEFGANEVIQLIQSIDDEINSLMIFGHNPTLTQLNNHLSNKRIDNLPTSGVVSIVFDVDSWDEINLAAGTQQFFEYPKKHKKK